MSFWCSGWQRILRELDQYHGCWCHGSLHNYVINSHGMVLVLTTKDKWNLVFHMERFQLPTPFQYQDEEMIEKNKYIFLFLLKPIQHVMLDLYVEWYYGKYDYLVLFTAMFHIIWGLLSTTGTTDNSFDTAHSTELVVYTRIQRTLYQAHNWSMSGWRYHVNILQRRKSIYSIYRSVFIAVYQSSITVQYHAVRYKHHELYWRIIGNRWNYRGLFNSLGPSDAIWRWRSWSTLVQVMALLPDGTKPLLEPMLTDDQWGDVAFTW